MKNPVPPLAAEAFPFHFAVDPDLRVIGCGRSLPRLIGGVGEGVKISDFVAWETGELDMESIARHDGRLAVLTIKGRGATLRGQFVLEGGCHVFLGSPWLRTPSDLERLGLQISDFALSDPVVDLMQVAQTQAVALEEVTELAAILRKQGRELRETNTRLLAREAEYRRLALIAARTDNAVILTDVDGRVQWVNDAFVRITGFTLEEVVGRTPGSLLQGPETDPATVEVMRKGLASGAGFDAEVLNYSKDGRKYWVSIEVRPITDEHGVFSGYMAIESDVTARREADERLQAAMSDVATQKARLDALIQHLDGAVLVEDARRHLAIMNRHFCDMFGIPPEVYDSRALIGADCQPMAAQAGSLFLNEAEFVPRIQRILDGKKPVLGEVLEMKDGRFLRRDFIPVIFENAERGFLWHYRDITREHRTLRVLESLARLSRVLLRGRLEDSSWAEALSILAGAVGAETAAAVHFEPSADSQVARWDVAPGLPALPGLSPDWRRSLELGDLVVEDGPRVARGGRASSAGTILVPVEVKGACWGCLVLVRRAGPFAIDASCHNLLRSAAVEIGLRLALQVDQDALAEARGEAHAAAEAADAASKAKSTFLAAMSHEIRTPLNAVIGMSSLLLDTPLNEQQQEYARTVISAGETLLELINDILDYSKIESGKVELDVAPFELRETLLEPLDMLAHVAASKGLELSYYVEPGVPWHFMGDRVRLKQILLNLLSNALRFTEDGEVALRVGIVETSGKRWKLHVSVKDTGCGISPDAVGRLFQPFSQADASITRTHGGTGLGLAISRRLVELMGGSLDVTSKDGEGSDFFFDITLDEAPAPPTLSEPDLAPIRGKRVLVVDDVDTNLRLLRSIGIHWGLDVVAIAHPEAALELLKTDRSFDLVILDFNMPGMNGVDLARRIRDGGLLDGVPLLLFGSTLREENFDGRELFRAMLLKPLRLSSFRKLILEILAPGAEPPEEPRPSGKVDPEIAKLAILVAEDNRNNQLMLRLMLARLGCKPKIVDNGQQAVDAIVAGERYDVAILDIQMPVMDGITAATKICALGPGRPYLIALTANAFREDRDACLRAGFDLYLPKPITAQKLGEELGAFARRRSGL